MSLTYSHTPSQRPMYKGLKAREGLSFSLTSPSHFCTKRDGSFCVLALFFDQDKQKPRKIVIHDADLSNYVEDLTIHDVDLTIIDADSTPAYAFHVL